MTQEEKIQIEERIVDVLKTVYDPKYPSTYTTSDSSTRLMSRTTDMLTST